MLSVSATVSRGGRSSAGGKAAIAGMSAGVPGDWLGRGSSERRRIDRAETIVDASGLSIIFSPDPSPSISDPIPRMANLLAVAPVLLVRDVTASAAYFRDRLGFEYDRLWGDPPDFCMVHRDGCTVMLSQAPASARLTPHWRVVGQMWNAYFWVDDAAALYEEFVTRGATIDYHLGRKPYGVLEFGVQDLDAHDIAFGQRLES